MKFPNQSHFAQVIKLGHKYCNGFIFWINKKISIRRTGPIHIVFGAKLAKKFAFSPRTLVRRFKNAIGITPLEYIQQVRIEAAKRMLEKRTDNISEIIFKCGYKDSTTFRKIFRRLTGLTPSKYKNKYGFD